MLDFFVSYLNYVDDLHVVGYSFGDEHVNTALRKWLEFTGTRTLTVVDPEVERIPDPVAYLPSQIQLRKLKASEFFAESKA
jgi:hypothetical protein